MKKKSKELFAARELRAFGKSINEIAKELNVSKGSVSSWVRTVKLDENSKSRLHSRAHSLAAIEKRSRARRESEKEKREHIELSARSEVDAISKRELWLLGTMLYWAEGGKTQRMVRFSNGDPEMIKVMIRYFIAVCEVPASKLKGYIHIHEHLDAESAEEYWSSVSGIPRSQFYKTYRKSKTSSKRRTLPYGVMDIYVLDVKLFLKIRGWTKGIYGCLNSE